MTIDYVVRKKAVDLYLSGHGRNEIARILNGQRMRISEATVTHLIRQYQQQKQSSSLEATIATVKSQEEPRKPSPSSTPPNDDNTDISIGIQSVTTHNTNSSSNIVTPRGADLSHLLNEDPDSTVTNTNSDDVIPSPLPPSTISIPPNPEYLFVKDPEKEMQVNIESGIISKQDVITQNEATQTEEQFDDQPSFPSSASKHQDPEDSSAIDWNPDDGYQRRLWRRILEEKEEKRKVLQLIEQRTHELNQERQNIIQMRYNIEQQRQDLQTRENRLIELEPLIPSAKQLKNIGIAFDQALVWVDCIKEVAQKERIDERTAAWKLAQTLRSFKELSDLEKAVQQTTQQLAMLNIVNEQQKQAIATLVDLRKAGFSEKEITELTSLVCRWNSKPGLDQGNGSSSSSNTNGSKLDDRLIENRLIS